MPELRKELHSPAPKRAAAALCLSPVYYFALSFVLRGIGLSAFAANMIFFSVGISVSLALFFPFLRESFSLLRAEPRRVFHALMLGGILHYGGLALVASVMLRLGIAPQTENNAIVLEMTRRAPAAMLLFSVVAAPITEECLFRGAVFAQLRKKSRFAAYAVTALGFALVHAAPGMAAGHMEDAFGSLVYIPPSVALCFAYEYSGTIWTSIFLHGAINAASYILVFLI
ncbi:MAG: CPBP family intramembrane metalloprotease [Oscillospiraceae bacterium]|nr:CPBP family intramembrane metalloprotease [Oscillospiraceae bacterium]